LTTGISVHTAWRASRPSFVHQACLYGSDDEFLAAAVPFIEDGLADGVPVAAVTTSANLDLLNRALGPRAGGIDYAETAYFGRRPAQRVAAFDRYLKRRRGGAGEVRILAEPVWTGRSERQIRAWKRMEASLNLIFAATRMRMICPYDTRLLRPDIVADACRTHPFTVTGRRSLPSGEYTDPAAFTGGCDAVPLRPAPGDATAMTFAGDVAGLRQFVDAEVTAHGLAGDDAALFLIAAVEAASYVRGDDGQVTVTVWETPGAIICDLHRPGGRLTDPLLGLLPAEIERPRRGDGLWLAGQVCELVETRSTDAGCTVRLHVATARAIG
jgi:hypothetical protein